VCQFPHRGPFDLFWLSEALLGQYPDKKTDRPTHTGMLRIRQNSHTAVHLIYFD